MSRKTAVDASKVTDRVLSPSDHLGINFNTYTSQMYALSLKEPSNYYKMREALKTALTTELIEKTFKTIFELLRYGNIGEEPYTGDNIPNYSIDKCNDFAMSVAKTFEVEISEPIMKILFAPDFDSISKNSLIAKAATASLV